MLDNDVINAELEEVNRRRSILGRPVVSCGHKIQKGGQLVGVALSGGGIRAAAFGIGAMEALSYTADPAFTGKSSRSLLARVDYLSSVSGGSYAACSIVSKIVQANAISPFPTTTGESASDYVSTIRN